MELKLPPSALRDPAFRDGRRERSNKSRRAIAQAMLDLIRETRALPTFEAVADRANVSRRSVFRHFSDTSALIVAAVDMQRADVSARFKTRDIRGVELSERVRLVAQRLGRINEYLTPLQALANTLRHEHPVVEAMLKEDKQIYIAHFDELFADVLADLDATQRTLLLRAMYSAGGWSTWSGLRQDQFLTVLGARKVVEYTLCALLIGVQRDR